MVGKEKGKEKEAEMETPTKKPAEAKKANAVVEESKMKGKGKDVMKDVKGEVDSAKAEGAAMPGKAAAKDSTKPSTTSKIEKEAKHAPTKNAPAASSGDAKDVPATSGKPETSKGRKHPGKLDITAAVEKSPEKAAQAKAGAADTGTPTAPTQTPSKVESPSVGSPAVKSAPRTLRVVQTPTPKAETPPITAPTPGPVAAAEKPRDAVPAAVRAPSRQPSIASIQNLPGTPSSEQVSISDNISMTSTSQSRANSPPPSARTADSAAGGSKIIGSAPVRQKTKAQAKKERQERARQLEEERVKAEAEAGAVAKVEEETPQQEAIVSRKKKAKKEKPAAVPRAPVKGKEKDDVKASAATAEKENSRSTSSRAPFPSAPKADKPSTSAKASRPSTPTKTPPAAPPQPQQPEPSPPPTPTLSAAQILADLKATTPGIQKSLDALLRASPAAFKPPHPISAKDLADPGRGWKSDLRFQLSREDVEGLVQGTLPAKRFGGKDGRVWDRAMVSPEGKVLRALTEELEQRFLELEAAVREAGELGVGGMGRWRPTKPQNDVRFPEVDLEALRRELGSAFAGALGAGGGGGGGVAGASGRGNTPMEQMLQEGAAGQGGSRRGAFLLDEVGRYINEFVMPPATPPPTTAAVHPQHQPPQQQQHGGAAPVPIAGHAGHGAPGESAGYGGPSGGPGPMSVEIAERALAEARRVSEEREVALRKAVRKNRRVLGLG